MQHKNYITHYVDPITIGEPLSMLRGVLNLEENFSGSVIIIL